MNSLEDILNQLPSIEEKIGYAFLNKALLMLAFVHRSFYNERRDVVNQHNERLEFLGDSVLGLVISEFLYLKLPDQTEGHLSNLRSHIVEAGSCTKLLAKLEIGQFVLLGKGERLNDGRGRETILADLFEALIGAIYLDGGLDAVRFFISAHFEEELQHFVETPLRNWKAELQDYSQKKYQKPPVYKIVKEVGPDHSKIFHVVACIDEDEVGSGTGASKKEAEQSAAEDALKKMTES